MSLLAIACGGDGDATATPTPTPTTETAAVEEPAPSDVRQFTVLTEDFEFDPSTINLDSGQQVDFTITNPTSTAHTFTIALTSAKQQIFMDVFMAAGETKSAEFTVPPSVAPGTTFSLYLFCRFHEGIGMTGTITVGSLGAAPMDTPVEAPSASGGLGSDEPY